MPRKKETKYKSSYNPDRECYISADGKYLCYETFDLDTKRLVTFRYEIGKDGITEELTFAIDDMYYRQDQVDRKENELKDPLFEAKYRNYKSGSKEDAVDPWDTILVHDGDPAEAIDHEEDKENPDTVKVREVIDTKCNKRQKELFFAHFGECKQLEQIRKEEAEQTGKLPSPAAMTSRKNKIIDKVAKSFGVERVKCHKYPKKD